VKHLVKKLWEGPSPMPTDLINQMTTPIQLAGELPRWHQEDVAIGLSKRISMTIPVLRKGAASSKDLLKAIGVSDEIVQQMLQLSNELHRGLKGGSKATESEVPD
jgi:hypothetical protein